MKIYFPDLRRMPKKKDIRPQTIKIMMEAGEINSLQDIFDILPRTNFARALHTSNPRFLRLAQNPGQFTFNDVKTMARLIGCKYSVLRDLVEREIRRQKAS